MVSILNAMLCYMSKIRQKHNSIFPRYMKSDNTSEFLNSHSFHRKIQLASSELQQSHNSNSSILVVSYNDKILGN